MSRVQMLPLNQLQPNPFQPRNKIIKEDLEELIQSVKAYGVLEPLVVAETPAGFQIIAGERRWRAAQAAGLSEIPVHIKKTTPKGMLEMALVENVQRVDLSSLERAQAFQQLIRDFGFANAELAGKIGKSPAYISNTLKLLELPDAIKDGLLGGLISEGHARALSSLDDEKLMVEVYKTVLKENASVRRTEELARRYKQAQGQVSTTGRGRPMSVNENEVKRWEATFQSFFNTKSKLKLTKSKRQTKLTIILNGSPEETAQDLEKILELAGK